MVDKLTERRWYVSIAILLLVAAWYLGSAGLAGGLGFPLDDSWIHQTYGRNLVRLGQFAYVPGQPSSGSTAPLWTLLLVPAYLLRVDPLAWAYVLGLLTLLLLATGVFRLGVQLFPARQAWAAWASFAILCEWHLGWAALSGMETLLFASGVVWLLERYMAWEVGQRSAAAPVAWKASPLLLGLISGLLILVRPEGLLLVALLAVAGCLCRFRRPLGRTLLIAADALAGVALLLVPYVLFNLFSSGSLFPNTFYAKQAEYASLLELPLAQRFWGVLKNTLVGAQVLLLPGAVVALVCLADLKLPVSLLGRHLKPGRLSANKDLGRFTRMAPFLWWLLSLLVYALRLPVGYQHGRYLMPTIPVLVLLGGMGTLAVVRPRSGKRAPRMLSRALLLATAALFVAFLVIGGRAYANDVEMINCEMVALARWLSANTPPGALVAAHDIGAIGYWADRPLLDLAGLVTPDVVPIIRDEQRLLQFAIDGGAEYLITFPSWYPAMVADPRLKQVYQSGCLSTRLQGGDNMAVYQVYP